jgi:hypothetical protein
VSWLLAAAVVGLTGAGVAGASASARLAASTALSAARARSPLVPAARSAAGGTLLQRTLLAVRNDPALDGQFEFGDVETQRKLAGTPAGGGIPTSRVWGHLVGVGTSLYEQNVSVKYGNVGVGPFDVDVALSIGSKTYEAIEARGGMHPAALRSALLALGAKPGTVAGHDGVVWGAEASLHLKAAGSFGLGIGALGEYDRTVFGDDLVVAGRRTAPVADLLGGSGATYAANPVMVATASCLGDVIAGLGMDFHGTELAAGVRRPAHAGAQPVEVLCAVPSPSARGADADAASLRKALNAKTTTVGASAPILMAISRSSVDEGSAGSMRFARATLYDQPGEQAGVSVLVFDLNEVQPLMGL